MLPIRVQNECDSWLYKRDWQDTATLVNAREELMQSQMSINNSNEAIMQETNILENALNNQVAFSYGALRWRFAYPIRSGL